MIVISLVGANADPQVQQGHTAANRAHMAFGHGEYGCPFPAPRTRGDHLQDGHRGPPGPPAGRAPGGRA
ncbi:hypothetical protein ACFSTC_54520 [Nonomuraea ferruginea]